MLEEAILEAKSGGSTDFVPRDAFSPQITIDAPVQIPEDYVPDLDLRMGLYRRLNDLEDARGVEAFAAELIDRFGKLPHATENLLTLIRIKQNCVKAGIARLDVGAKGALVAFHDDNFRNPAGLIDYVQRLQGTAKLRPDNKLVITRAWKDGAARLHAGLQLSKGLAKVAG
jgi:transcription-repair coupling factor (superfamily II helicase)